MRNTVIKVGLFLCAFIFLSVHHVNALGANLKAVNNDPFHLMDGKVASSESETKVIKAVQPIEEVKPAEVVKPVLPEPVQYTVLPGDSLTKIAESHQTEWKRLYAKNVQIVNPDIVNVGEVITIPTPDEQLTERALPTPEPVLMSVQLPPNTTRSAGASVTQIRTSSSGNTYSAGYCTWYAKNRRPDLPNRLGNASAWVANAASQGFATGSTPQAGAIGQQGNHVVYVESVNGDGTVTISEMNYKGLYVISSRTVSSTSFSYIY